MKIQHMILATVLVSGVALSTAALSQESQQTVQPNMPMMYGPQGQMPMGYSQGPMMNPMMRQQMMRMHQQGYDMPMSGGPGNMMGGNQDGMPMMGRGQGGRPMMQMMQARHAEMTTHRQAMEKRLANIEALLQELIKLQKAK